MKFATTIPFAALAGAFVLPDVQLFEQLGINGDRKDAGSWRDSLPSKDAIISTFEDTLESFASGIDEAVHTVEHLLEDEFADRPGHGRGHGRGNANLTIYQLISASNHTKRFAKLVDEHESIVKLLNSTEANYTLFVPSDRAFEHIPDHPDKKPSKEFLEALLQYHIGLGLFPAGRVIATPTIPTALHEALLGDRPQRLRTSVGLGGVSINIYSKVVAANIVAKNGVIHAVNHILVPPPFVGKELSLLPGVFSTLLLAYDKTDFVSFIHGVKTNGTTVFAPSNEAFKRLGPAANAFLFNTERGLGYLKALLKYQIVANATLYSNAFYDDRDSSADGGNVYEELAEREHVELQTLLDGKSLGVDVSRWGGFVRMRVNGFVPVVVRDAVARNGVIQIVGRVPIPPHKHHGDAVVQDDGEVEVEDLIRRLEDYVDDVERDAGDWIGEL